MTSAVAFDVPATTAGLSHIAGATVSPPPASEASGGEGLGVGGYFFNRIAVFPPTRPGCAQARSGAPSPPLRGGRENNRLSLHMR